MPPTVIKICASQILRLAIRRYALEHTKNALGEKCEGEWVGGINFSTLRVVSMFLDAGTALKCSNHDSTGQLRQDALALTGEPTD